jgi:hypothetical protein
MRSSRKRALASAALVVASVLGFGTGAAATGATVAITNVQVNPVHAGPFSSNKQNEPSLAVNPLNPMQMVAGSNDEINEPNCTGGATSGDCGFAPNIGVSGAYYSSDGGQSWHSIAGGDAGQPGVLPGYSKFGYNADGDPQQAFGPTYLGNGRFSATQETVYYANLAGPNNGAPKGANELMAVSRSYDAGQSYVDPVFATSADNPADFNDKEAIWADNSPASPHRGTVYASWTLFPGKDANSFNARILLTKSTDGGATWSRAQHMSRSTNNNSTGGRQGSSIRTDNAGNVYVFWQDSCNKQSCEVVSVSRDGGKTFSNATPIALNADFPIQPWGDSAIPGANFRVDVFGTPDYDASNDTMYLTFGDSAGHIWVVSSHAGGAWSVPVKVSHDADGIGFFPSLAAAGGRVTVFYQALKATSSDYYAGAGNAVIRNYAASSTGSGWSHLVVDTTTAGYDPDGASTNGLTEQFWGDYTSAVATDANHVFGDWTDTRAATPCAAVDTWRDDVSEGTATTATRPNPDLVCDNTFGNTDIFMGVLSFP